MSERWKYLDTDLDEIDKKMCPSCELAAVCLTGADDFAWLSVLLHGGPRINAVMCNNCTAIWLLGGKPAMLTTRMKMQCQKVVRYLGYWSNRLSRCPKCESQLKVYSVVKPDDKWNSCVFVHHIQWAGDGRGQP